MSAPLSPERLAEIAARAEAATPGPWGTYDDGTGRLDIAADLEETGVGFTCRRSIAQTDDDPIDNDPSHVDWDSDRDLEQIQADGAFIAAARTDVPALLAEVDQLRTAARAAAGIFRQIADRSEAQQLPNPSMLRQAASDLARIAGDRS